MMLRVISRILDLFDTKRFQCPVCAYSGTFRSVSHSTGRRKHAKCPKCRAFERHRLQFLVLEQLFRECPPDEMRVLHFAPEDFIKDYLLQHVGAYLSTDIERRDVDCISDIQSLPFPDHSYDMVYASHVLEHVRNDGLALSEIVRILRPGGVAVLPVPIVANKTIEYEEPNPHESFHVRAPGYDYYKRYSDVFREVKILETRDFAGRFQTFVYEDRTGYPSKQSPLRPPLSGERHSDFGPICRV